MSNGKKILLTLEEKDKNTISKREIFYTPLSYNELKNYIYKIFHIKYLYENTIFEIYAILCDKKDIKILIDEYNINNINNDLDNLNEFYIKLEKKNKNLNETDVKQNNNNNNIEHNHTNLKKMLIEFKKEIITDLTKQINNIINNKNNDRNKNNNVSENIQLILECLNSNYNAISEIKNNIKSLNDKMLKIENDINIINLNFKNEVKNLKNNETNLNDKLSEKNNISNNTDDNKIKKEILKPGISVDFTNEISDISLQDLYNNRAFMNIKIKNNGEKIWPNDLYLINYEKNIESKSLYFKPILINDGISVAPMQEFNYNIKIKKNSADYINLTDYTFPIAIIDQNKKLLVEEIGNKTISIIENLSRKYEIEDLNKSWKEFNKKKENENIGKNIKTNINENKLIRYNTDYNLYNNKFENNNHQTKPENEKNNTNFNNKKSNFEKEKIDNIKNKINNESKKDINNLCNELKNELGNLFTLDQIKESLIKNKLDKEKAKNYLYSISIVI